MASLVALVSAATRLGGSSVAHAETQSPAAGRNDGALWTQPVRSMRLDEALAYAEAHQPSLRVALDRVVAAESDARIPRARWMPLVAAVAEGIEGTANNTTASYLGVSDVPLPRIGATKAVDRGTWSPSPSTLVAGSLTQEVYDFGRIAAQSAAADAATKVAAAAANSERLRIRLLVKEAYFAVQGAKAILRAAEQAYARTRVHRDLAAAGVKSGLYAPIELTRAEADLARFDVTRLRAQGGLASARVLLAAAVAVPDGMLDADESSPGVPPLPSLDQALAIGLARNSFIAEQQKRLVAQDALTRAISAESTPELIAAASLSGRAGGAAPSSGSPATYGGYVPDVANWSAGLVLQWPLYDPVVAARAQAAMTRQQVQKDALVAVTQEQLVEIQRAYVDTEVASASLAGLERSVEAAQANYAQAEARFKAGLGTALELADAEYVRTDAEIQLAGGRFAVARARAVLGRLLAEDT